MGTGGAIQDIGNSAISFCHGVLGGAAGPGLGPNPNPGASGPLDRLFSSGQVLQQAQCALLACMLSSPHRERQRTRNGLHFIMRAQDLPGDDEALARYTSFYEKKMLSNKILALF